MASMCAAGHAIAGRKMFYRPIKSAILITIYFVLSAVTLFVLSFRGWGDAVAWLIATQFAGYAVPLRFSPRLAPSPHLERRWGSYQAQTVLPRRSPKPALGCAEETAQVAET
jgi:hypothetical protein